jgi:hypothetical protein
MVDGDYQHAVGAVGRRHWPGGGCRPGRDKQSGKDRPGHKALGPSRPADPGWLPGVEGDLPALPGWCPKRARPEPTQFYEHLHGTGGI